jgi:DNA polymerase II large subunit
MEAVRDFFQLSLTSPFKTSQAYTNQQATDIYLFATTKALEIIRSAELSSLVGDKDDIFLVFDALLVDFAALNPSFSGINCDEFRAICTLFDMDVD